MTFGEFCERLLQDQRPDSDSVVALPSASPYYSTEWGGRVIEHLKGFTKATRLLYAVQSPLVIVSGDLVLRLDDLENSVKDFFEVKKVWIEGTEIVRMSSLDELYSTFSIGTTGTPTKWIQFDDWSIHFDVEPDATLDDCYAAGLYRHTSPYIEVGDPAEAVGDALELEFHSDNAALASQFVKYFMAKNIASDEVGLARLASDSKALSDAVKALRGKMNRLRWS